MAALVLLAGACGGTGPPPSPPAGPTPGSTVAATAVPGGSTATLAPGTLPPAATASADPGGRPRFASVAVTTRSVAAGLAAPLWVTSAGDGSGRLFVAEQGGRVRVIRDGSLQPTPYLDLADRIASGGERGLLGLAFAPGFGSAGEDRLYVHYSNLAGDTTISELRAAAGADAVDPATERILLVEPQPFANHNGGWIGFDPTGMLLVALGDGGSRGDPDNRASNLKTPLGKILRIDVLHPSAGQAYGIPADNPWAEDADARREILHFGLRNPFRASVDPVTGSLWIGDVGQDRWEEIDVVPGDARGVDFGWRRWEGRHCYEPAVGCDAADVTMPVAEYGHDAGCSVIGGVVYRDDGIPALRGAYLFSDYCSGTLWGLDAGLEADLGAEQTPVVLLETGRSISSIGTGEAGEVYLTDLAGGEVLRLVAST